MSVGLSDIALTQHFLFLIFKPVFEHWTGGDATPTSRTERHCWIDAMSENPTDALTCYRARMSGHLTWHDNRVTIELPSLRRRYERRSSTSLERRSPRARCIRKSASGVRDTPRRRRRRQRWDRRRRRRWATWWDTSRTFLTSSGNSPKPASPSL